MKATLGGVYQSGFGRSGGWERDLIAAAATFVLPERWPANTGSCRAYLYDYAAVSGARVALGDIALDTAYAWVKEACWSASVATRGKIISKRVFPLCVWFIDQAIARVEPVVARADDVAFKHLREIALGGLSAGCIDRDVRRAMTDAALCLLPQPPESLLHQALAAATSDARRNARWQSSRAMQS